MTNIPEGLKNFKECELCKIFGIDRSCTNIARQRSTKVMEGSDEPFVVLGLIKQCFVRLRINDAFNEAKGTMNEDPAKIKKEIRHWLKYKRVNPAPSK